MTNPYFWVGELKYSRIFKFLGKKSKKNCLSGLWKNFGWRKTGTTNFFLGKSHMFFGDTPPVKKGVGIRFWRNFEKKIGTIGMIIPRPYSKTWFFLSTLYILHVYILHILYILYWFVFGTYLTVNCENNYSLKKPILLHKKSTTFF